MVMHARKLPRLNNDGYYDRHQGNSHQNSRYNSRGTNSNRQNSYDRSRGSPNGRLDSPEDNNSPVRNRSYANKSSYSQRLHDHNERDKYDRDRDIVRHDREEKYDRERDTGSRYDRDRFNNSRYDRYSEKEKDGSSRKYENSSSNNRDRPQSSRYESSRDRQTRYDKEKEYKYDRTDRDTRQYNSIERRSTDRSLSPRDKRHLNKDGYQSNNDRSLNEKYSNSSSSKNWNSTASGSVITVNSVSPLRITPTKSLNIPQTSLNTGVSSHEHSSTNVTQIPATIEAKSSVISSSQPVQNTTTATATPSVKCSNNSQVNSIHRSLSNSTNTSVATNSKDQSNPKKEVIIKEKRDENNRLIRYGDWSEHFSSIGKCYYYNCRTEASTWEKPPEWLRREAEINSSISAKLNTPSGSRPSIAPPRTNETQSQDMEICSGSSTPTSSELCNTKSNNNNNRNSSVVVINNNDVVIDISVSPVANNINSYLTNSISNNQMIKIEKASSISSNSPCAARKSSIVEKTDPIDTNDRGPPTPTHSENYDIDPQKYNNQQNANTSTLQNMSLSSTSNINNTTATGSGTNNTNSPSVSRTVVSSYTPAVPQLPSSLSKYVREDLTQHVRNWGTDALDKQAAKLKEDRHMVCYLQSAKVSAELKSLRSRVRINEIMSTLCEQRLLVAQEKLKVFENMKSHNMMYPVSDDEKPS